MDKKTKNVLDKYIYKRSMTYSNDQNLVIAYYFGYLDGYFDEEVYKNYIPSKSDIVDSYDFGFSNGQSDKQSMYDKYLSFDYREEKYEWIKKLAIYEGINSLEPSNLKEESRDIYSLIQNSKFVSMDKVKLSLSDKFLVNDYIKGKRR